MAELLIRNIDNFGSSLHEKQCYKRGDVVEVRPDGSKYGKRELTDRYVILKIPGVDPKDLQKLVEILWIGDERLGQSMEMYRKRRFRFPIEKLKLADKTLLESKVTSAIAKIEFINTLSEDKAP